MDIVRLIHPSESANATAKVFNEYFLADRSTRTDNVIIYEFTGTECIKELQAVLAMYKDIEIWPSMFLSEHWGDLFEWRDRIRPDISIHIYVNTIVSRLSEIIHIARLMRPEDSLVFNTFFSMAFVEEFLPRDVSVKGVVKPVGLYRSRVIDSNPRKHQVVVVSRLEYTKNILDSIRAVGLLKKKPKMVICVFSDQSEKSTYYFQQLEKEALMQDVCVEWRFDSSAEERDILFRESSLCLVLSTTTEETQGKVVIESALNGCMPVVNRWNGLPEYVDRGAIIRTGWDMKRGAYIDIKQLAGKISVYCESRTDTDAIRAQYCKNIVDRYADQVGSKEEYSLTGRGAEPSHERIIGLYLGKNEEILSPDLARMPITEDPLVYLTWRKRYKKANPGTDLAAFDKEWLGKCEHKDRWYIVLSLILDECFKGEEVYSFVVIASLLEEMGCYRSVAQLFRGFADE